jgi:hypothetical protein
VRHQLVLGEAEEREVTLVHPREQGRGFLALVAAQRRRRRTQLGDEVGGPTAHCGPVLDGGRDLAQHVDQPLPQPLELGCRAHTIDLHADERFRQRAVLVRGVRREYGGELAVGVPPNADHRVDEQVDPRVLAAQLHRGRVDQERHVVCYELDDRVRGLPSVLLEVRVVDADVRRAGLALAGEAPVGERGAIEVERVELGEVLGRHPAVVLPNELLDLPRLALVEPLADACADGLDQRALDLLQPGHRPTCVSSVVSSRTSRSTNPSGAGPGAAAGSRSYRYGAR